MNLPLQLDRGNGAPLQDQLFYQLRQLIVDGSLKPNTRVIATRFLAEQVGVSRTTVLLAYERLISEGYLETRPAVGTFVSGALPEQARRETPRVMIGDTPRQASLRPALLHRNGDTRPLASSALTGFDLSPSRHDTTNLLPPKFWLKGVRNVFGRDPDGLAHQPPALGVLALRQAIADHLAATRGIMVPPEQVVVVTGRRQACSLVAHLFQRAADHVVLESPGDEEIETFFEMHRAALVRVPVDEHGLCTELLPPGPVSLAYVTPARQNPLGGTMPQSRREALIAWARKVGAYIIEDDSDSELRYHGSPPLPLAAIDPYGLVFHTCSFAKTLGAGLGLGYLVVPREFVGAVSDIMSLTESNCSWLVQMVLADLLAGGEYHHHLRRLRKVYMGRRDCLVEALSSRFGDLQLVGADAGTQLTWLLPEGFPTAETVRTRASACGVTLGSVSVGASTTSILRQLCDRALILGFAAAGCEALRQGIETLAGAIGRDSFVTNGTL
jgi:GntR family transcriptional regulator/MocR family aminotransferase